MAFWSWLTTAAGNATADSTINFAEGQSPSSYNDSARSLMAALAQFRDDNSGLLTTAGSSVAYTVTTNQGFASTPNDGQTVAMGMHVTNGASPTLQADSGGTYAIQTAPGTPVSSGVLIAGAIYQFRFSASQSAWILFNIASIGPSPVNPSFSVVRRTFSANGTYTPTSNMVFALVECIGGGGGGGGAAAPATGGCNGAGGGGGGFARRLLTAAQVGASQTVTVGAGGSSGGSSGAAGGVGTQTSLGVLVVAGGGSGGGGATATGLFGTGGPRGSGSTGDDLMPGGDGQSSPGTLTAAIFLPSGGGGNSFFGGGAGSVTSSAGSLQVAGLSAAANSGGGGSGGSCRATGAGAAGGAGGSGYCSILEFIFVA